MPGGPDELHVQDVAKCPAWRQVADRGDGVAIMLAEICQVVDVEVPGSDERRVPGIAVHRIGSCWIIVVFMRTEQSQISP